MFRPYLLAACILGLACTTGFSQQTVSAPPLKTLFVNLRSAQNVPGKSLLLATIGEVLIARLPASKDSAISYFEQGLVLGKRLRYDSGIVRNMLGLARVWVQLSYLKREAEESDSIEYLYLTRHFDAFIAYIKEQKDNKKTARGYYTLAGLLPLESTVYYEIPTVLYDSASVYYHKAQDAAMESLSTYWAGWHYQQLSDSEEGDRRLRKSIAIAEAAGQKAYPDAYALLGNNLVSQGNFTGGLTLLLTAYHISAKDSASYDAEKASNFGVLCIYMGLTYERLKNSKEALKYQLTAVHTLEPFADSYGKELLSAAGNAVTNMVTLHKSHEALAFLTQLHRRHPSLNSLPNHHVAVIGFMKIYTELGNIRLAQKYCDTLIVLTEKRDFRNRSRPYSQVVRFFIDSRQYDKAKKYGLLLEQIITQTNQQEFRARTYSMLHKIDSALGDFKSALHYHKQYKLLSDSALNETSVKEIERLNIEFDTRNKEQQLALVSKDAELTRQQLHQAEVRTKITVASLVVAILVLALILHLYRVKRRTGDELRVQRDEINRKNLALERAVQEKEWLLQEVHHRVKNNLHMISNLLSMQAYDLRDDRAKTAITDSHNRVQAMSIVHQKLSADNRVSRVHFSSYLGDLIDQLKSSYDTRRVHFQVAAEPLILDAGKAISLGLIVNEAVTNSIKYAFPNNRVGTVSVTLRRTEEVLWKLAIEDDGVGIPVDEPFPPKSIGLTLIEGIARELDGEVEINSSNGFLLEITFPLSAQ